MFFGPVSHFSLSAETGLKVKIKPPQAVQDGAMWRYKEKNSDAATWSSWWGSGQTAELFAADFLVEFKDTNSNKWVTPEIRTVTVHEDEVKVINQTYASTDALASIKVNLNPEGIRGDATWSLYYLTGVWGSTIKTYIGEDLASGETLSFAPVAVEFYVEYGFVQDLARPSDERVTIIPGSPLELTREYKKLIVGNVCIFGNKLEYNDTGFRTYGTTFWSFVYYTVPGDIRFIKCKADLQGTFSPPVIKGNGTLHANEDLGILDNMFSLFSDKKFYNGKFLLDANTLDAIETSKQRPIWEGWMGLVYSFKVTDFKLIKSPTFGLIQTAEGYFDLPIFSEPSIFRFEELETSQQDSAPQIMGDIIWEGAEVAGLFTISETNVHIDTSTHTFTADGFDVEVHQVLPSFRGEIRIEDGVVKKLGAELYSIGKKVEDWPILFDNCGFSFAHPEKKSVKVNISAGVKFVIPGTSIDAGSESWEGDLDINGHLKLSGEREIFGYEIGSSETEVQWKGSQQYISSFVDASFYPAGYVQFLIEGQGYIYIQWKPSFSYNGWIMAAGWVPLPDWLASILPGWLLEQVEDDRINLGSFTVSIDALGMNIKVTILKIFTFNINIPPFWENSSGGPDSFQLTSVERNDAFTSHFLNTGSVENFTVQPGEAGFILSLQGSGGAPDAVLVTPGGTRIDPRTFVNGNDGVHVGTDDARSVTGFIVTDPEPGLWVVEIMNSAGVTQRLIRGNHPPRILPDELVREANGSYTLTYEAFDADNEAEITFYHSPDFNSFQGRLIGTARENDGNGTFSWYPDPDTTSSGFISAQIDDGINPPQRVYFEGRTISPNAPAPPDFSGARMSGDTLILTFDDLDFTGIESFKVYYSEDLETENLTEYFTVFPGSQIELDNNPLPPGRVYQLRVTTLDRENGESGFSAPVTIDYRLTTGNNYPHIISSPVLRPRRFSKDRIGDIHPGGDSRSYSYQLKVNDYDGDPLYYSLIRGPEQLVVSAGGLIHGEFPAKASGTKSVIVQVNDGRGGTDVQKFRIDLTPENGNDVLSVSRSSALDKLIITLRDATGNSNPHEMDTIFSSLLDPATGIQWNVTLRETSAGSGRFQGLVRLNQGQRDMMGSAKRAFILRCEKKNGAEKIFRSGRM